MTELLQVGSLCSPMLLVLLTSRLILLTSNA